jgi:hypothetical protein
MIKRQVTVLWNTFGECNNYGVLKGHQGAILDLHWTRDSRYVLLLQRSKQTRLLIVTKVTLCQHQQTRRWLCGMQKQGSE